MSVTLKKGKNISLTKESPKLKEILIGLGWDVGDLESFDLDASLFMLTKKGIVKNEDDFIFYNNLESSCKSVKHTGDNRTGAGEGDDETLQVNLKKVPDYVEKLVVTVTIHEAEHRHQDFSKVKGSYIRILNLEDSKEICRFDLTEDSKGENAIIFGEIYRDEDDWKFKAIGQWVKGGLRKLCQSYGIEVQ